MQTFPIKVMFEGKPALIKFFGKDYAEARKNADDFESANQAPRFDKLADDRK